MDNETERALTSQDSYYAIVNGPSVLQRIRSYLQISILRVSLNCTRWSWFYRPWQSHCRIWRRRLSERTSKPRRTIGTYSDFPKTVSIQCLQDDDRDTLKVTRLFTLPASSSEIALSNWTIRNVSRQDLRWPIFWEQVGDLFVPPW